MNRKIYILFGGPSSEHEVSFGTRDYFLKLYRDKQPTTIYWRRDGKFEIMGEEYSEDKVISFLSEKKAVVLIAAHGEKVEDGYIQQKFEKERIPFTGSDSDSCELSMDKYRSMEHVKSIVNVPKTYKTAPADFNFQKMVKIIGKDYPLFVKPVDLGSSVDIHKVESETKLKKLIKRLSRDEYLFQSEIKGTEVSLASVREDNSFMNLYPTEIIPSSDFFDYKAKYIPGQSEEITPARISEKLTKKLQEKTNKIHQALGLGYYSRSDFIIDENEEIFYLETNSLPGMTQTSLVPQQLKYSEKVKDFIEGLINRKNLIG